MKKIIQTCILIIAAIAATTDVNAQFSAGGGLLYGFENERAGLRADGVYAINENIRAAADFGFYFPETSNSSFYSYTYKWWEFNANAHYLFVNNEEWNVYGLAGINYLNFSYSEEFDMPPGTASGSGIRVTAAKGAHDIVAAQVPAEMVSHGATHPGFDDSSSETGLNIGIGGEYKISFGSVFGELKYAGIGGDADQLVLGIGVRYNF